MHSSTLAVKTTIGVAIAVIALGCGNNPTAGDAAYKQGALSNGGFLFGCADGVACRTFSGDAEKFPKDGVALSSTFGVRFVDNDHQGDIKIIDFNTNDTAYNGVTVTGLEPFFSAAPATYGGIVAGDRAGVGTLIAREADGTIVDFISLPIVKAAKLVVYDADDDDGKDLEKITLDTKDLTRVRIVAQSAASNNLAGSVTHAWTFDDPTVAKVDSSSDGVSSFSGLKAGNTNVTLDGAGFRRTIPVEVK